MKTCILHGTKKACHFWQAFQGGPVRASPAIWPDVICRAPGPREPPQGPSPPGPFGTTSKPRLFAILAARYRLPCYPPEPPEQVTDAGNNLPLELTKPVLLLAVPGAPNLDPGYTCKLQMSFSFLPFVGFAVPCLYTSMTLGLGSREFVTFP